LTTGNRIQTILVMAAFSLFVLAPNAISERADQTIESILTSQYDWIVSIDVSCSPQYLEFPTSSLTGLDLCSATFQESASKYALRGLTAPVLPSCTYEQFWYHNGRSIGMRRQCKLPSRVDTHGVLYFRSSANNGIFNQAQSVANCIAHLFLEAGLDKSAVAAAVVPDSAFDRVCDSLAAYGFYPVQPETRRKHLTLRLLSYPKSVERFLYLDEN
jgi:hypothetical protein